MASGGDTINRPIELGHPADVSFGVKDLNARQHRVLDLLPGFGSQVIVRKRDVSMLDLAALTAKTGDEFAMFTHKGERLIIRGDSRHIRINEDDIILLRAEGYRWSGHTHPGITSVDLEASQGDKDALSAFGQSNSVIYNAAGKHRLIYPKEGTM
jgi:hypothetical protein